jgi:hypothetical protein
MTYLFKVQLTLAIILYGKMITDFMGPKSNTEFVRVRETKRLVQMSCFYTTLICEEGSEN